MKDHDQKQSLRRSQWSLVVLTVALTTGVVMYRLIVRGRLEQTSLLFIGIPAVLAVILAMTPNAKTAKGAIIKGLTLALLLSGPVLGEGFICIVMASPVFYMVGLAIGAIVDFNRGKRQTTISCIVLLLLPMSIEGSSQRLSFNREEIVHASQVVDGTEADIQLALGRSPRTDLPLPLFGRMGFPKPTQAWGVGLEVGATRRIHFAGGEGNPGDLLLKVSESRPGYVRFEAASDHSKIAHWLRWKFAEVQWTAVDEHHTRVIWSLHFERRLDPAWYFGPWERYAAHLAAEYLIRANATPRPEKQGTRS